LNQQRTATLHRFSHSASYQLCVTSLAVNPQPVGTRQPATHSSSASKQHVGMLASEGKFTSNSKIYTINFATQTFFGE